MTPFDRIAYDTACIEEATAPLYEEELRRHDDAREVWGGIRQDINTDLERALIQPYEGEF